MKLLQKNKDGGILSKVWAYWLIEYKPLFSIALLKFENGSREAYHTHAFNSISWLIKGKLFEDTVWVRSASGKIQHRKIYKPSLNPIITTRDNFHKVTSVGTTWVLTFRGPWVDRWKEQTNSDGEYTLTHGRKRI